MFLFPTSDDNEHGHRHHHQDFIHYGIIATCFLLFGVTYYMERWAPGSTAFLNHWTFTPGVYLGTDFPVIPFADQLARVGSMMAHHGFLVCAQILVSTFLHGSFGHVAGNMFLLWMLGDNVEYAMGHLRYLLFFFLAAILSALLALFWSTAASYGAGIGASGALMGVAGAYMFYFPKARVNIFYFMPPYWIGVTSIPARVFIGFYAMTDLIVAYQGWGTNYGNIGVMNHVMGFLCGLLFAWPLRQYGGDELEEPLIIKPYRKTVKQVWAEHDHWGEGR